MFLVKEALFLLLNAYICLIARGQNTTPMPKVRLCNDYADVAFLVDVSNRIGYDIINPGYFDRQIKQFLKSFVVRLNVGPGKIQVGLVTFGNYGYVQFTLKSNVDEIIRGIDNIVYPSTNESRNTGGGIYVMRTQVLGANSSNYRPDASHLCVIVTDGESNFDRQYTVTVYASDAKNQGIIIFSLGYTPLINVQELVGMASSFIPEINTTIIAKAFFTSTFGFSGAVAYFPAIKDLNSLVQQISNYVGQADCKQVYKCTDDAERCRGVLPGDCYGPVTERTCCLTCRLNLTRIPYCRYGDAYTWCAPKYCWDNNTNLQCCSSCPSAPCIDKAYWCNSIFSGSCYNEAIERICCNFCRGKLRADLSCRYGDQFPWCSSQTCWDTNNCCVSCPKYILTKE